ncbi:hypothetical protein CEXT_591581 [Caerostris extrusa]|uniref:Uncharacterized protein n=1 Tax=Caerostris extrusa TaxID=172846 RepID=A0AAV4VWY7_CAEEX|nr:hypothetical protein CEXT_591581 [Caerostris extrusa]
MMMARITAVDTATRGTTVVLEGFGGHVVDRFDDVLLQDDLHARNFTKVRRGGTKETCWSYLGTNLLLQKTALFTRWWMATCIQLNTPNQTRRYKFGNSEPSSETIRREADGSFENMFTLIGCFNPPPYEKKGRLLTLEEEEIKNEALEGNEWRTEHEVGEECYAN